ARAGSPITRRAAMKAASSLSFSTTSARVTSNSSRAMPPRLAKRKRSSAFISRCTQAGASGKPKLLREENVEILDVIKNRRSDRHFNGRPVAQTDIDLLIEAF